MGSFLLGLLLKIISSETTKVVIGIAVNKLLEHKSDGITKDIAKVMIDGIAKSKANDVDIKSLADVSKLLK